MNTLYRVICAAWERVIDDTDEHGKIVWLKIPESQCFVMWMENEGRDFEKNSPHVLEHRWRHWKKSHVLTFENYPVKIV